MITWTQAMTATAFHAGTCRKLLPPHTVHWIGHRCVRAGPTVETEHGWSIPTQSLNKSGNTTIGRGYGTIDEDHADWHHVAEDCRPHTILPSGREINVDGEEVSDALLGKQVTAGGVRMAREEVS